jgi:hypothetical protein
MSGGDAVSRRRNGTNRAGKMVNASRYTGYGKPIKKVVSLTELNDRIQKITQSDYIRDYGGLQDGRKNN